MHAHCVLASTVGAMRASEYWEGDAPAWLIEAALLHDVGKAQAKITVWHRTLIVLLGALRPGWLAPLTRPPTPGQARSWRYPFYVARRHAALGADLCAEAGCAPETVTLVRLHEGEDVQTRAQLTPLLRAALEVLRRADDAS